MDHPVVVIGAGPIGLAAAAHLVKRDLPFLVLESGVGPAASVRRWGHVRLFSPWRYNTDAAARRLLSAAGWLSPDPETLPTGAELADRYLQPLADLEPIAPHIRYRARVIAISRVDIDRLRTAGRDATPYVVRLQDGTEITAQAVIDAAGTWRTPNVLGANGLPAHGISTGAITRPTRRVNHPQALSRDSEPHRPRACRTRRRAPPRPARTG
ncbi:FAD-dependent oxidoreductase [Microtetraspora sp. AC03309]|uniref:FAD-dependent oxidoreductase n=1 Tax=Microtetraspora sp. AC03309 TaxID=2779376 RepID=UPI001E609EEA|nr:FAD-dependent oxidoreductase [Microtetraspora sp. AC03309]MCC5576283.1 FAD-dependent oxidoreductase [Microtetraspora sp. AC03309]